MQVMWNIDFNSINATNSPDFISTFDVSAEAAAVWKISVRLELFAMEFVSAFVAVVVLVIFVISFIVGMADDVEHETVS